MRVRRAAGALAEQGVEHDDRVLVHARNSNAVLETMFASWMLGAVWVPTRAVQRSQLNFQLRSASAPARAAAYRS
jgi:acyl-CoA synthetase (AMP-forming)/AMP-acid ligase II